MIKLVALIKRRSDVTPEAFRDYYEHRHALLFRESIPPEVADAIASYTQSHAVELGGSGTALKAQTLGYPHEWLDADHRRALF